MEQRSERNRSTALPPSGILLIPGGRGARRVIYHRQDIIQRMKLMVSNADACLLVAGESGFLAQTGILYRRNIASCSTSENWRRMFTAEVHWIDHLPWVADGKFYSSDSSIHGIDMTLGAVADLFDLEDAITAAENIGYAWDPEAGYL